MKKLPWIVGAAVAVTMGAGCVPWREVSSPGAAGIVVDAQTYQPVSGAEAVVCRPTESTRAPKSVEARLKNARPPKVLTKTNGQFSIGAEHALALYPPLEVDAPITGELIITRDGYEPARLEVTADAKMAGGESHFLTGDVANLAEFARLLKRPADPVSLWLAEAFSERGRKALAGYPGAGMDDALLQAILVKELNTVIDGPVIYEATRFREVKLKAQALELMRHDESLGAMTKGMDEEAYRRAYPNATTPAQLRAFLNRELLEEVYPNELSNKRGSGYYRNVGVVLLTPIEK